jgi:molybdopterin converting factor small subunit
MRVRIPSPLQSYTGAATIDADGDSLDAALHDIDRRCPGFRFRMVDEQNRIRRHIRVFVNGAQTFDLAVKLRASDDIAIVQALSGG